MESDSKASTLATEAKKGEGCAPSVEIPDAALEPHRLGGVEDERGPMQLALGRRHGARLDRFNLIKGRGIGSGHWAQITRLEPENTDWINGGLGCQASNAAGQKPGGG